MLIELTDDVMRHSWLTLRDQLIPTLEEEFDEEPVSFVEKKLADSLCIIKLYNKLYRIQARPQDYDEEKISSSFRQLMSANNALEDNSELKEHMQQFVSASTDFYEHIFCGTGGILYGYDIKQGLALFLINEIRKLRKLATTKETDWLQYLILLPEGQDEANLRKINRLMNLIFHPEFKYPKALFLSELPMTSVQSSNNGSR